MVKRIAVIQGHPDGHTRHFGHALEDAYVQGASDAGHEVRRIVVAELEFPIVRSREEWEHDQPPASIQRAQETLDWGDHLVIVYPLWLGAPPALLKGFLEQVFRPGYAFDYGRPGRGVGKRLTGKSARIIVTMGMPSFVYRWYFRAHSLRSLKRNILAFVGIAPVRTSIVGMVETPNAKTRERWLRRMQVLGRRAV